MSRRFFLLAAAAGLGLLAPAVLVPSPAVAGAPGIPLAPRIDVAMARVPIAVHRRATRFLEEQRRRDDGPEGHSTWAHARLSDRAVPLRLPGETSPAYWELSIADAQGAPRGFVVLSVDERDAPIAEASEGGLSPSARLLADAASRADVAHVFRLSSGVYVAEDGHGAEVARIGATPGRPVGFDPAWLSLSDEERAGHAHYEALSLQGGRFDDHRPAAGQGLTFVPWASWAELAGSYAEVYAPMLAIRRRNAAAAWDVEKRIERWGEALATHHMRRVPVLQGHGAVTATVEGSGSGYVTLEHLSTGPSGGEELVVVTETIPDEQVREADLHLRYADGAEETSRFTVSRAVPDHALLGQVVVTPPPPRVVVTPPPPRSGSVVVVTPPPPRNSTVSVTPPAPRAGTSELLSPLTRCSQVAIRSYFRTWVGGVGYATLSARVPFESALLKIENQPGNRVSFMSGSYTFTRQADDSYQSTLQPRGDGHLLGVRELDAGFTGVLFSVRAREWLQATPDGRVRAVAFPPGVQPAQWETFEVFCEPSPTESRWGDDQNTFGAAWSSVRKWDQIPANRAPNTSPCFSGCGPTAWAMLFGWADYKASTTTNGVWSRHDGLYRRDGARSGPEAVAPEYMWSSQPGALVVNPAAMQPLEPGVVNTIWEVRSYLDNVAAAGCAPNGSRWTAPQIMAQAHQYFAGRAAISLTADYDGLGVMTGNGKNKAVAVLRDFHRPVLLGTGDLIGNGHYPFGIGYQVVTYRQYDRNARSFTGPAQSERFVVHNGHQEAWADTVPAGTWFQGWIHPSPRKGT